MTHTDAVAFVPRLLLERTGEADRHWRSDCTLALLDISGFTSLSEQLARRGRVGAEDLVSTLTRMFTLLLSATDDGGDVLKFAGDALLVQYDGPDHAVRACHAASAIQRLLAVVGGVRLAGARARLRMSVGIHTGTFDYLETGGAHRNLVVTGPPLDQVLALQDAALPGQILVSDEVAAALPPYSVGERSGPGRRLRRVPSVPSLGSTWRPAVPPDDLERLLPAVFSGRLDLLTADSDHRRAAVGFVQVSGLGALLAEGSSAAVAAVEELTAVVEDACRATGTSLLDTDMARDGYRYFLAAGAPRADEDPEGRLIRTLLQVTSHRGPLAVRAGATSGRVFAGAVGSPFRRTFTVMGDTTNLAARLTAKAAPGTVLAQRQALTRAQTVFASTPVEPLALKGKRDPVPAAVVTEVRGARARAFLRPGFVGREAELERIGAALIRGAAGDGSVVEVVGEPGLGKTRLVDEAVSRSGLPAVRLGADPYGAAVPYRVVGDLLRTLLGLRPDAGEDEVRDHVLTVVEGRRPELVPWLSLLDPVLRTSFAQARVVRDLDARFRAARTRETVRSLLEALVTAPTALVIDDAHWCDPASAELLTHAFTHLDGIPWVVLLTRRDVASGLGGDDALAAEVVRPAPVDDDTARALVNEAASDARRPADVDALVRRASGNPFFLIELATTEDSAGELSASVEELVGQRLDDLDATSRDALRQAAVLGSRFSTALHVAVSRSGLLTDEGRVPAVLAPFLQVHGDGAISFRREVYREVAYQQLTFRRRRELHERAARSIEAAPSLAGLNPEPLLSLHFHAAGSWNDAYRWSREAAELARRQYAHNETVEFCRRAIDAGRRSGVGADELRPLYLVRGESARFAGRHEESIAAYTAARRGLHDPVAVADVTRKISDACRDADRLPQALAAATRVRALAGSMSGEDRDAWCAEAALLAAGLRLAQGRSAECRRVSLEAVTHAERLPPGDRRTRLLATAYSLHDTADIELDSGSGRYGELPVTMFEEIGDYYHQGRFCVNVAVAHYLRGDWDRAVTLYRQSLRIAERIGDVLNVAIAQMNIGELLAYQGKPSEARPLLRASLTTLRALHVPLPAAHAACYLGVTALVDGELDEAGDWFTESARLFESLGRTSGWSLDDLATRRLELDLALGRIAGVRSVAQTLLARTPPLAAEHRQRVLRWLGLACAAAGELQAGEQHLRAGLQVARDSDIPYEEALTQLALVDAGLDPESERAKARAVLDSLGVILQVPAEG